MVIEAHPGLCVCVELRAAFVQSVHTAEPRDTIYFSLKYDLPEAAVPGNCSKVTLVGALFTLWRSTADTIELPEPLWIRFLPRWLLLASVWKLRRLRGRGTTIGIYAIENNSLDTLFFGRRRAPRPLVAATRMALRLVTQAFVNRCAFGSPAAAALYLPLVTGRRSRVEWRTVPELPTRTIAAAALSRPRRGAAFVGRLERRKGVAILMEVWPEVEVRIPDAHLTILGGGPLAYAVADWVAQRPESRTFLGMRSHAEVLATLQAVSVVIAPSIPDGRWREQIGNPITEALSTGATVVTSTETGLAKMLVRHGHTVIPVHQLEAQLGTGIVRALQEPLSVEEVVAVLPTVHTRLQVDRWIHRPVATGTDRDVPNPNRP